MSLPEVAELEQKIDLLIATVMDLRKAKEELEQKLEEKIEENRQLKEEIERREEERRVLREKIGSLIEKLSKI